MMLSQYKPQLSRNRRGQGLVEYALIIAGVALIGAVGISLFGHKAAQMIDAVAVILPAADSDDNGPIGVGELIETTSATNGQIGLNTAAIAAANGTSRLTSNVTGNNSDGFNGLVVDVEPTATSGSGS
jgi:pilus assembly protein Flp/PilA